MSSQWIAVDAFFPGSTLYGRLQAELGPAGPLAWINLLCWAKRSGRDGTVKYLSAPDALDNLGLGGADLGQPPEEWLEAFWRLLAKMKQASRGYRRDAVGAARKVKVTNYKAWQKDRASIAEAPRKHRGSTAEAPSEHRDTAATPPRKGRPDDTNDAHETRPDSDTTRHDNLPPPPPPSSTDAEAHPPGDVPPRRGRGRPSSGNGNGHPPNLVGAAIAVIAANRLTDARAEIAAGRRQPIHHESAWLAATTTDIAATAAADLELLAAAEQITDPVALAAAWHAKTTPAATPAPAGVHPPDIVRCPACSLLTHDCVCR